MLIVGGVLGLVFAARLSLWRKQPTRGITIAIGLLAAASVLRAPQVGDGILDQLVAPANISEMISHAFALAASCALATFALSVRQREHLIPVALRGCELWIAALMLCWSVSDASRIQVPSIAMLDGPMVAAYWLVFISGSARAWPASDWSSCGSHRRRLAGRFAQRCSCSASRSASKSLTSRPEFWCSFPPSITGLIWRMSTHFHGSHCAQVRIWRSPPLDSFRF
ncbi:hypothetical protein GS938_17895 [Rhodococcus hoagii]|nr:hypothetical protein [Prescottella equi]